jgi:DNA-binding GntR family transcriptional regulator
MSKQNKLYKQLLSPSSLTDQACNMIKDVILSDKYSPNQRLNEVELASSLGVSRGPIREAFQRLAYEGLIKLVPNKGAFVISFSSKEVEDIYELREYLEIMAVKLATERACPSDFRKLSGLLKATKRLIEKNRYTSYPWDSDFHLQIARCAKNEKLLEYINKLNSQMQLIRYKSGSKEGRAAEAFKEHTEIYSALCERNCEKSEQLMVNHIRTSKNNIRLLKNSLGPLFEESATSYNAPESIIMTKGMVRPVI